MRCGTYGGVWNVWKWSERPDDRYINWGGVEVARTMIAVERKSVVDRVVQALSAPACKARQGTLSNSRSSTRQIRSPKHVAPIKQVRGRAVHIKKMREKERVRKPSTSSRVHCPLSLCPRPLGCHFHGGSGGEYTRSNFGIPL